MMRFFLGLFVGLVIALAFGSMAQLVPQVQLYLEGGQCKYGRAEDGTFYQSDRATNNDLLANCGSIGIGKKINDTTWKVTYHSLGTIRAQENHCTQRDEDAFQKSLPPCDPETREGCTMVMQGAGRNFGISFSAVRSKPLAGFEVLSELGVLFFKGRFDASATTEYGQRLRAKEHSDWKNMPAPMIGLGLQKGPVYVMARKFISLGHRELSLTNHSVTQVVAGLSFSL